MTRKIHFQDPANLKQRSSSGEQLPNDPNLKHSETEFIDKHEETLRQLDRLAYIQAELEFQRKQKMHVDLSVALSSHTHPGELVNHQRHHELDGYVHSDAHEMKLKGKYSRVIQTIQTMRKSTTTPRNKRGGRGSPWN